MADSMRFADDTYARPAASAAEDLAADTLDLGSGTDALKESVEEVSAAAVDAAASIRYATEDTFSDIAVTLRELIREKPLAAVALSAGAAFVLARLLR